MFILYKNTRRFASQRIEREVSFSKKFYSAAPLCRPSKKTERRAKPFRASIVPGGMYGGGLRALPQFAMVVPRRAQSALAALPCSLGLLRAASRTARALRAPLWSIPPARLRRATSLWSQRRLRVLTKSRKNEALIRNDGVYVISGIFCRANACEKVKARRAEGARTRPKGVRSAGTPRKRSAGRCET